jgi:hypothetical protein
MNVESLRFSAIGAHNGNDENASNNCVEDIYHLFAKLHLVRCWIELEQKDILCKEVHDFNRKARRGGQNPLKS